MLGDVNGTVSCLMGIGRCNGIWITFGRCWQGCSLRSSDSRRSLVWYRVELLGEEDADAVDEWEETKDSSNVCKSLDEKETGEWITFEPLELVGDSPVGVTTTRVEAECFASGKAATSDLGGLIWDSIDWFPDALLKGVEGSIAARESKWTKLRGTRTRLFTLTPEFTIYWSMDPLAVFPAIPEEKLRVRLNWLNTDEEYLPIGLKEKHLICWLHCLRCFYPSPHSHWGYSLMFKVRIE